MPDMPGLFDAPAAPVSLKRQASRIELIILGKRSSLERFGKPGRHKWPDNELESMRVAIAELEAVHGTLRGLCEREHRAA